MSTTAFKYSSAISKIHGCPPPICESKSANVYRFVWEDVADPRNFLPIAVLDPSRLRLAANDDCCTLYALSFFQTQKAAEKRYAGLKKSRKLIHNKLGTHLALVHVEPVDGVFTPVSGSGHLELHEYEGTDLCSKATVVSSL